MKRSKPMRRSRSNGGPDVELEPKPWAVALVAAAKSLRAGTYEGTTSGPAPKTVAYRDPVLLEMVRGRHCLMRVPGICAGATETTIAAHSNLLAHGKGKSRKADDCYAVGCCFSCHFWLDNGMASADDKEVTFMTAHARQVLQWRFIATDPAEPERYRRAARRALERLGATPLGV